MKIRKGPAYFVSRFVLVFLVAATFFPLLMMINMSLKKNIVIKMNFLAWPAPWEINWSNYISAWNFVKHPIWNSLLVCFASLVFIIFIVSLSGYTFGRMRFRGKELCFGLILFVLMIPYNMLLIPNYSLIRKFGLLNSYWALIIPYIAGQQIFGIVLGRAFFSSLPQEMFDAAKIDGVTEFQAYRMIALPLSVPTLITVGITAIVAMYNDYIWPTIVLTTGDKMKTFCQIVFNNCAGNGTSDYGMTTAAFVIGTLPLLIITVSCLRYYLQGMLAGAIKG